MKIATVVNFPSGEAPVDEVKKQIIEAVANGADEIDLVLPYKKLIGELKMNQSISDELSEEIISYVKVCKSACAGKHLKVIIESGEFERQVNELSGGSEAVTVGIRTASSLAMKGVVDFIKTSTGKVQVNATTSASRIMLEEIKRHKLETGRTVGFKAAGGIRKVEDGIKYINIVKEIMGDGYVNSDYFRIGASSLLKDILATLATE